MIPRGGRRRGQEALARFLRAYGPRYSFLDHGTPFQLLVAVILSAQCTDAMVNKVTPELFRRWPTPQALADAPRAEVEQVVFRTGFYRAKAKNVQACARMLVERFGGEVPRGMADLTSLPGVARKTANVVQGNVWGESEGVCVDTHVGRVARRLGLTRAQDPEGVEDDLVRLYPKEQWVEVPYQFIQLGRSFCDAKKPRCGECHLADLCPKRGV